MQRFIIAIVIGMEIGLLAMGGFTAMKKARSPPPRQAPGGAPARQPDTMTA